MRRLPVRRRLFGGARLPGVIELLVSCVFATCVACMWVEVAEQLRLTQNDDQPLEPNDRLTDCSGHISGVNFLLLLLINVLAYPGIACIAAWALHRRGGSMSSVVPVPDVLLSGFGMCASMGNSTWVYYFLGWLRGSNFRERSSTRHAKCGGFRPTPGVGKLSFSDYHAQNYHVERIILSDLATAVILTFTAAFVTSRTTRSEASPQDDRMHLSWITLFGDTVVCVLTRSFGTSVGYCWNIVFSDALLVPLLQWVLPDADEDDDFFAGLKLARAGALLLCVPPLHVYFFPRAGVSSSTPGAAQAAATPSRKVICDHLSPFVDALRDLLEVAILAMVGAAFAGAVFDYSLSLQRGLSFSLLVATLVTATALILGCHTKWSPSSKWGKYFQAQLRYLVCFLYWYPGDDLLDKLQALLGVVPVCSKGSWMRIGCRLALLIPLSLLGTALIVIGASIVVSEAAHDRLRILRTPLINVRSQLPAVTDTQCRLG